MVVVGGGVIGLACAWRAAAAGIETVVVDAGQAERASEVAAGMIAPVGEATWGEEAMLEAAVASAAAWPAFAAELERDSRGGVPYRRCGALHVALDGDEAAGLRRSHDLHERHGLRARPLRSRECRRLEPGVSPNAVGGLEAPDEAEVDPRALLAALRAGLAASGGRLEAEASVGEIIIEGDSVAGVRLTGGERMRSDRVLLAAGARAGGSLLPEGLRPPVRPVKGEILRLRAPAGARPCERLIVTERVYIVPRAGGEVVVGATVEDRGFDLRVTAGGVHELLREAYRVLPEIAELELVEASAGLRPGTPDNAPLIGRGGAEGLLHAGGHGRNGILLAPITAQAIAAELTGEGVPPEAEAFGPDRFTRGLQEVRA